MDFYRGREKNEAIGLSISYDRHRFSTRIACFGALCFVFVKVLLQANRIISWILVWAMDGFLLNITHHCNWGRYILAPKSITNMNLIDIRTRDNFLALLKVNSLSVNHKPLNCGSDPSQRAQDLHHDREQLETKKSQRIVTTP